MHKLILSISLSLLFLPSPLFAQNRECPPQGYYGAMSEVCHPPQQSSETWEANELQKREETAKKTRIVCVKSNRTDGRGNDETDVAQRCRVVTDN